jgi:hypothetical protein
LGDLFADGRIQLRQILKNDLGRFGLGLFASGYRAMMGM